MKSSRLAPERRTCWLAGLAPAADSLAGPRYAGRARSPGQRRGSRVNPLSEAGLGWLGWLARSLASVSAGFRLDVGLSSYDFLGFPRISDDFNWISVDFGWISAVSQLSRRS